MTNLSLALEWIIRVLSHRIDDTAAGIRLYRHIVDEVDGDIQVLLLYYEDFSRKVSCLVCLIGGQTVDIRVDQKDVGKIVHLFLRDVRLLENIAVDADVPALVSPVRVAPAFGCLATYP